MKRKNIENIERYHYYWERHHKRFLKRIKRDHQTCPWCGGAGGETEPVLDYGEGPWFPCGLCEGEGVTTVWLAMWGLRYLKQEKKNGRN